MVEEDTAPMSGQRHIETLGTIVVSYEPEARKSKTKNGRDTTVSGCSPNASSGVASTGSSLVETSVIHWESRKLCYKNPVEGAIASSIDLKHMPRSSQQQ